MRFAISAEQRSFGQALTGLLTAADVPAATRAWAAGDDAPGLRLWGQLAELGVTALVVPEESGGIDGTPLDLAVAFECLGHHGVPGPWIESVALAPSLLAGTKHHELLADLADGTARVTIAAAPLTPYALDAGSATHAFVLDGDALSAARATSELTSVDRSRRLHVVEADGPSEILADTAVARGLDLAALACSASLVGAGERLLRDSVTYVGQRRQFGRVIGEYQALKHALADVRVALDFARPLVHGAARGLESGGDDATRDVSAAKVAATDAATLAARTALQVHGAIGYTMEHDLSIWILRVRALAGAWGTTSHHRGRVLDHLMRSAACTSD
ncbi:acyl-CoA/acyl-ACP dehydrogenase [Nocardioides sp. JQ2195]|uniref:acyl-CoA dehydrogenase family protein n=1 Tax=Nocardioides sp. JQ2195 TaxID=2592334 RepID=UPI00143E2D7F|nr:acyl-CoA dehydrogenase family protein [Nocardioides sp. JQ2195]QIX26578.1 acyl-CoA/acyl-ACP dehydrogenase [Nocardioides sp. JQ2195]